jgi:nicotinamide-nucleotide amidase
LDTLHEISAETQRIFSRSIYEVREWVGEQRPAPREIEEVVADLLRERGQKVAVAESCTGGLLGKYLTDFAGSSDVFVGGIVSYSNEMKQNLLGVSEKTLFEHGAVSCETASEMVKGLLARTGADWGVALTGIAGPGGGTVSKPVGLVWIGVGCSEKTETRSYVFSGDRAMVRERAVVAALRMLWLRLREINDGE